MPAQYLTGVAINHHRQAGPTISACPDAAQVGCPPLIRRLRHRWHRLYAWAKAYGPLLDLPTADLKDALHRVLVKAQQTGHRSIPIRGVLVDHGFDGLLKPILHLGDRLGGLVIHGSPGNLKPMTQSAHRNRDTLRLQIPLDTQDHFSSSVPSRD